MTTKELALALPTGSLDAYYRAVNAAPMLSADEERALALRYREENDLSAAWELVMSHLRFVVRIARGYSGYGLPEGDLVQEGTVGLMKAVKRFDPERGVRLVSFAVHWIKAEIHEYVLRNWRIVKVATTKAQRKLFYNLRSSRKRLGWMKHQEVNDLATDLDVSADTVREMEKRLNARDAAFDTGPMGDDGEQLAPAGFLADSGADPATRVEEDDWDAHSRERLASALEGLDDRSRDIVRRRWLEEPHDTLHQLAAEYGVSAERIRQIEQAALARLRVGFADC